VGFQREYIQGFVNLIETSPASGGNVVIPGSHLQLERLAKEYLQPGRGPGIPADHQIYSSAIRSHLGAGDLFLWDSRCIHGNGPGDGSPTAKAMLDARPVRACVRACLRTARPTRAP
jgi:ectoine hydroxylase-related dioxygenase (phytanoyl-CoA dioxygenase family)